MTELVVAFRQATPPDAPSLADFAERTFRATYAEFNTAPNMDAYVGGAFSATIQRAEIDNPDVIVLLAETGGELAGYAQLTSRLTASGPELEIDRFYVDIPWHGRGVAKQLMDGVVEIASTAGARQIVLGVWQENRRAITFYTKVGFAIASPATFLLGNDLQHDWIMTLPLEQP